MNRVPTLMLFMCLSGCQTTDEEQPIANPQTPAAVPVVPSSTHFTWQLGKFTVQFDAGKVEHSDEGTIPHSAYKVRYERPSVPSLTAIAYSAQDIETLTYEERFHLPELIRVHVSPSGKSLLIDEYVPNDGAPCRNYIHLEIREDALAFSYLLLPKQALPSPVTSKLGTVVYAPIHQQVPSVTSLSENTVHFRYPDGIEDSLPLKDVQRASRPMFP